MATDFLKKYNLDLPISKVRGLPGGERAELINKFLYRSFYPGFSVEAQALWLSVLMQAVTDLGYLIEWRKERGRCDGIPTARGVRDFSGADPEAAFMDRTIDPIIAIIGIMPDYVHSMLLDIRMLKRFPRGVAPDPVIFQFTKTEGLNIEKR